MPTNVLSSINIKRRWRILTHWRFFLTLGIPLALMPLLFLEDTMEIDGEVEETKVFFDPDGCCIRYQELMLQIRYYLVASGYLVALEAKFRCAYVMLLMAIYWIVEVVPLPITSLLPVVLFPLFGVMKTADVTINYMREANMMFLGVYTIALAVEYSNLHKRIALRILMILGSSPIQLLTGFMVTCMFLSMWMSNVAAVAVMAPIVLSIHQEIADESREEPISNNSDLASQNFAADGGDRSFLECDNVDAIRPTTSLTKSSSKKKYFKRQKLMYLFAIGYGSRLGACSVVTSVPSSLATLQLLQAIDISQDGKYLDLTYATWMAYTVPAMILIGIVMWAYLILNFIGVLRWMACWRKARPDEEDFEKKRLEINAIIKRVVKSKYDSLGSLTFHEIAVAILTFLAVLLWFFRDPRFIPGWSELLDAVKIDDSTAAMLIVFLIFIIPKDPSFIFTNKPSVSGALLEWKSVQQRLPWGVLVLIGGGRAISDAAEKSHLSNWLGEQLKGLDDSWDKSIILLICMLAAATVTEFVSNTTCVNIIVPILITLSKNLGIHPLYLTLPTAISCEFAFIFPSSTPTNALIYEAGGVDMRIVDMAKTGIFVNIFCLLILYFMHFTYANFLFNFEDYQYPNKTRSVLF